MTWLTVAMRLFPTVIALMRAAEELFDDVPESGEAKKSLVMEAVTAILTGVGEFVDAPELLDKVKRAIGFVVDAACVFLFGSKAPK
ncbi:MAG: hypothetical protein PHQ43_12105 [Dehalococcoidales bacterium]|nr:hypothetical protein [Dehalococcoidales bacterium]